MELEAASSVINFMSAIESQSAEWYTQHSRNQPNLETQFTAFAGENQKFAKRLKKSYYSGVTDALETNFSFQGLEAAVEIPESAEPAIPEQLPALSVELEKSIQSFYFTGRRPLQRFAGRFPRAMERFGRAREKRIEAHLALQRSA
jgi:hypothetical protein